MSGLRSLRWLIALFGLEAVVVGAIAYAYAKRYVKHKLQLEASKSNNTTHNNNKSSSKTDEQKGRLVKPVLSPIPPASHDDWIKRREEVLAFKERQRDLERQRVEELKQKNAIMLKEAYKVAEDGALSKELAVDNEDIPKRIRRAEKVLSGRTSRFLLVLESCHDACNQQAVLRTAEAMGIQNVWLVLAGDEKNQSMAKKIVKGASCWLTIRRFGSCLECIAALREEGYMIWATDLHPQAECLSRIQSEIPKKLAIVIGRESDGVSQTMLNAADKRVFIDMHGFTGSFNLSVASALVLQSLFVACPEARGDMTPAETQEIRKCWYSKLNKSKSDKARFDHFRELADQGGVAGIEDLRTDGPDSQPRIPPKLKKKMLMHETEKARKAEAALLASGGVAVGGDMDVNVDVDGDGDGDGDGDSDDGMNE